MKAASPTQQRHHETPEKDRVPLREKIGLGFGRMVTDGTHGTLHVLINPIFNMTLGVNPALISTIIFIQRIWDAMLDPLCGQFSDNFRSKWGRRRPLLLLGAFPVAALFAALWWFPERRQHELPLLASAPRLARLLCRLRNLHDAAQRPDRRSDRRLSRAHAARRHRARLWLCGADRQPVDLSAHSDVGRTRGGPGRTRHGDHRRRPLDRDRLRVCCFSSSRWSRCFSAGSGFMRR